MKVLVLGLSRTGTMSIRQALRELGLSDVYHFVSIVENPADSKLWIQALEWKIEGKGSWTRENWDALLGHCMAVTDNPCAIFCDELLEAYPDAKVILTVRDNVDVWHQSVMETIWPFIEVVNLSNVSVWRRIWQRFLDPNPFMKMMELVHLNPNGMFYQFPHQGKTFYEVHNEKIRKVVPKERFLEFNVKQGWGPLCDFLGYEVPEWEFPRVNEKATFVAGRERGIGYMNLVVAKNMTKYAFGCGAVGLVLWKCWRMLRIK